MKSWGSQVVSLHFLLLFREQREASRESRGTAMSPPRRHTDVAKSLARTPHRPSASCRLGVQSTMRAAALAAGRPSEYRPPGSDGAGPDLSIRRVAHSLRTASADSRLSARIAKAASWRVGSQNGRPRRTIPEVSGQKSMVGHTSMSLRRGRRQRRLLLRLPASQGLVPAALLRR